MLTFPKEAPFVLITLVAAFTWLFQALDTQSKDILILKYDVTRNVQEGKYSLELTISNLSRSKSISDVSVGLQCPHTLECVSGASREMVYPGTINGELTQQESESQIKSLMTFSLRLPQGGRAGFTVPLVNNQTEVQIVFYDENTKRQEALWIVKNWFPSAFVISNLFDLYIYTATILLILIVGLTLRTRTS